MEEFQVEINLMLQLQEIIKKILEEKWNKLMKFLQLCIIYSIQIKINIYKKIKICISLWKFIIT